MNHKEQLINLKKIEGQVRGLQSMIDDEKYCIDIPVSYTHLTLPTTP